MIPFNVYFYKLIKRVENFYISKQLTERRNRGMLNLTISECPSIQDEAIWVESIIKEKLRQKQKHKFNQSGIH